jgi:hypothetical protein
MTNPELIEQVRELRQRGRTPKEIARTLGLPPSAVAPLIRAVAAAQPAREAAFVGCWVNQGWAASDITFGREGKPMYIQGPHDDAASIIRTLRRSAGGDHFHYIRQIADSGTAP